MQKLDIDSVIKIYLGESVIDGMSIDESKSLAYLEIQKRTLEYRKINNIDSLVSEVNNVASQIQNINNTYQNRFALTFINSYFMSNEINQIKEYSVKKYYPNPNLLDEYYSKLCNIVEIWSTDPERIRYSSKFNDRRSDFQSQEYIKDVIEPRFLYSKTTQWSYDYSALFGFGYLSGIINQCVKSDICILPISSADGSFQEIALIFNFMLNYNVKKNNSAKLWFVFFEHLECKEYTEIIIKDIRNLAYKVYKNSGFTFDLIPITIITQEENGNWNFDYLLNELDFFANKRIDNSHNVLLNTLSHI